MPDIILHHNDLSPFAEKIRLAQGYKIVLAICEGRARAAATTF